MSPLKGRSILLVTSNEIYKNYISDLLRIWGCSLYFFEKIDDALMFVASEKPNLTALIVPLKHKGTAGEQIAKLICDEIGKSVPWICMQVGSSSCDQVVPSHQASAVLGTMFTPEELYAEIARLQT
ncbi:hypothetical protein [Azospirillum brasilense]|uniref:hypothetical protein n=1 Tax=Azospirillum brasilense TaxID=192 RepID=UPI0011C4933C|nr:hypothetical protein [Azospirillum brasilense]NUB27016.1 hypothetical protein [Azospirillum brasilense]NUB34778.1 hypothetical protein [Azospirillum brasilense]